MTKERTPEERVAELEEQLEEARGEVTASAGRAIPNIVVEVLEGVSVTHGGKLHKPGDRFEIEGPSAISLVQSGHVMIVGSK